MGSVDKCAKMIQHIWNILLDLDLLSKFTSGPTPIHDNNSTTIQRWHGMTTEGLKHIQLWENAVQEDVQCGVINVRKIEQKFNASDIFTKEDKDTKYFIAWKCTLVHPSPFIRNGMTADLGNKQPHLPPNSSPEACVFKKCPNGTFLQNSLMQKRRGKLSVCLSLLFPWSLSLHW